MNESISIVGLGKLGLSLAVAFADRDFHIVGVDIQPDVVKTINAGKPHIYEPGVNNLLAGVVESGKLIARVGRREGIVRAWIDV